MKKIVIISICMVFIFSFSSYIFANSNGCEFNNKSWEYRLGDFNLDTELAYNLKKADDWESFDLESSLSEAKNYNYLWIRVKLCDQEIDNPTLYLPGVLTIEYPYPYQLYLNGELIYQNGYLENELRLAKERHSLVSLPSGWEDNYLYFRFYNNEQEFNIGEEIIADIGPYRDLLENLFLEHTPNLSVGLTYLLIGIFLIIIYLLKLKQKIHFYMAIFMLAISIYTLRYNAIILNIFDDFSYYLYLIYYFSIFILVASFSQILSEIIISKKSLFKIISYLYLVGMTIALVLYFYDPFSVLKVLKFYNLSIILFALFAFFHLLKVILSAKEKAKDEFKIIFVGVSAYGVSAILFVLDMLTVQFNLYFISDWFKLIPINFLSVGVFLLVLSLVYLTAKRFSNLYNELREYSQELKIANKALKQIDEFKDEFIFKTSKELKLPLNNIISNIEVVIRNNLSILSTKAKKNLTETIKIGEGLSYLIDSFIDYVAMKRKDIESQRKYLELSSFIDYFINFFQSLLIDKNIKLENNIENNKFIIIADKSQLIQALYNLLNQIISFSQTQAIVFAAEKDKKRITLKLKFKTNKLLFKFQTELNNFKESGKYILELDHLKQSIILNLIKEQNGEIEIKKLENRILGLFITLPGVDYNDSYQVENKEIKQISEEKSNLASKSKVKPSIGKKRILIISDQNENNDILNKVLSTENYQVETIYNQKEVTDSLDSDVALLILNLFSINESMLDFCVKVRNRFKLFELPILVILSRSELDDLILGFEAGVNDFIKKPFVVSEFKAKVRTLLVLKEKVEESIQHEQNFLRAQIKPHFLYNTLDTIAYLCKDNPEQASNLVIELANYLRYSFDFKNLNKLVSIKKELELVEFYLSIQKVRFGDRVKVIYDIKTDLIFRLPPLILQPLVENSVKHGLLNKKSGGTVKIIIKETDGYFLIRVSDNGVGMTKKELDNLFKKSVDKERNRVGIKNINQRLKKIYNQELKIKSTKDKGTTVEFEIPNNY